MEPSGTDHFFMPVREIDGDQFAERGRIAGQPAGGAQMLAHHGVGSAALRADFDIETVLMGDLHFIAELVARDQPDDRREAVRGDDQVAALRFIRAAAPIDAADVAGENDGSFQTRRREKAAPVEAFESRFAPGFVGRREPPGIVGREFLRRENVVLRERLRGRRLLAWNFRLRNSALLDRQQRFSGHAVEDEEMADLGGDGDGGNAFPCHQSGLRGDIVIPEVVMNHLKSPQNLARRRA